jgi:hypothetical protein
MAPGTLTPAALARWRDGGGKLNVEWTTGGEGGWDVHRFIAFADGVLEVRIHTTGRPSHELLSDLQEPFIERARITWTRAATTVSSARPAGRLYRPEPPPDGCTERDAEWDPGIVGEWVCRHDDVVLVTASTRVAQHLGSADGAWAESVWREMGGVGDPANSGLRFWRDECGRRRARWVGAAAAPEVDPNSFVMNVVEVGAQLLAVKLQLDALAPLDREWYLAIERAFAAAPLAKCGDAHRPS